MKILMTDDETLVVEHVFINLSKRKVTLVDNEGYEQDIDYKFDSEGSAGFTETIGMIQDQVESDQITYVFSEDLEK